MSMDSNSTADKQSFVLRTDRLPTDRKFMPTLCNGHVGFTVFSDTILMNGLYSGRGGNSRRARIPNWININYTAVSALSKSGGAEWRYELDMQDGYFRAFRTIGDLNIEQRYYAHRYYTRTLIYELIVHREDATDSLEFTGLAHHGGYSDELYFTAYGPQVLRGVTIRSEHELFQRRKRTIYVAFSENLKTRRVLRMLAGEKELYYRYVVAIDECETVASKELKDVLALDTKSLLEQHAAEWRQFWNAFSICVEGNRKFAQTTNAALFYMANSLPSQRSYQPNLPYFGLSPVGLGRGNRVDDYEGHNFWDTEIWMLPVVTQLSPSWSKLLFEYRLDHLAGAEYNARQTGYKGARFPWESAFTGTEVTQPGYPKVAKYQVHISADIVFGLQQFFATTNDREWLRSVAWPLTEKIAAFLVSRAEKNVDTDTYHIKDVMCPDEYHSNVDDNVYTNVVFKIALEFASFLQQQFCPDLADEAAVWQEVASKLVILYDPELDYHPQFRGFKPDEMIKQADVVLVGFPLQFALEKSTQINDLDIYARNTSARGPAMTWSMYSINYLDVGLTENADYFFEKGFQSYVDTAFMVWRENTNSFRGAGNFLTGTGGFLQAIISGYGGVRYHRQDNRCIMEIKSTRLLPNTDKFTIQGLKFADSTFKLQVEREVSTLECLFLGEKALEFEMGDTKVQLSKGYKTVLNEVAFIKTT